MNNIIASHAWCIFIINNISLINLLVFPFHNNRPVTTNLNIEVEATANTAQAMLIKGVSLEINLNEVY